MAFFPYRSARSRHSIGHSISVVPNANWSRPQGDILLRAPALFSSTKLGNLLLFDNKSHRTRVCFSCRGFFNADKILSEYRYRGNFKHQIFFCTDCARRLTQTYINAAGALEAALPPPGEETSRFDKKSFWELVEDFKKIPTLSLIPFLRGTLRNLPVGLVLKAEDQAKLLKAPIKIQQLVLQTLSPPFFDESIRNKMLLKVLRAYGKRDRTENLNIHQIPMEVVRQLKPLTILRALEKSVKSAGASETVVAEISGKFFPTILKEGPYTERAKKFIRGLRDNLEETLLSDLLESLASPESDELLCV